MTLAERLAQAHQESVRLYLLRQHVEENRHRLTAQALQIDHELIRLDGDIRTLEATIAEEAL